MLKFQSVIIDPTFSNLGKYASLMSFWLEVMLMLASCILTPAMPVHTSLSNLFSNLYCSSSGCIAAEEHQVTCKLGSGISNNIYSHTLVRFTPRWHPHDRAASDRRALLQYYTTFLQCYRHPSFTPSCIVLWLAFLRMLEVKLAFLRVYRGIVGIVMIKIAWGAERSPITISIGSKARSSFTQGHIP